MDPIMPTTYPTCQTCKHWDAIYHPIFQPQAECRIINSDSGDEGMAGVYLQGATAMLTTRPSFGCLLHSELAEATT